jgi:two-component system, cell cycle sensor histidine kinase and response regulator CckA
MPIRLTQATILVVDDEVALRQLIVRQLRIEGYKVLEAGYGMEALAVAATSPEPIDLVLSDIRMPGMPGTELAQHLMAEHPGLQVVLMSAHPIDDLTFSTDCRGVITVLTKPFESKSLLALVKLVLETGSTTPEQAEHLKAHRIRSIRKSWRINRNKKATSPGKA